eukprot:g7828.t1
MDVARDIHTTELQTTTSLVKSMEPLETSNSRQRQTTQGSLEALSLRVLELLEGLNEREADSIESHPTSLENTLIHFEQKLQNSNSVNHRRPFWFSVHQLCLIQEDTSSVLSEFQEVKTAVQHLQAKKINSALLAELVETVQVLLRGSSPHQGNSSVPSSPGADILDLIKCIKARTSLSSKDSSSDFVELDSMLQTLSREIKILIEKNNGLEEDRSALIQLVSSGQELLADLVKENESLEQQLTHQVTSQGNRFLLESKTQEQTNIANHSNGSEIGAYTEEDVLHAFYKEKAKSEYFELQSTNLAVQANQAQKELEQLKSEKQDLMRLIDQTSWIEDRNHLIQVLEEEKEKVSTWHEEVEYLEQQLKTAQQTIEELKTQKHELQRAVDETSWAKDRLELIQSLNKQQESLNEVTGELKDKIEELREAWKSNEKLQSEINHLTQRLDDNSSWNRQELSFKLDIAEKQNRILDLTSVLDTTQRKLSGTEQCLTDCQSEMEALRGQLDEVSWADEKQQLLQALEQEIEKHSSWEEDQVALENQVATLTEEAANLKAENSSLLASIEEVSWIKEKQELCEALEEEKEKFSSWREEMEALEEENKELKHVFHESKERDIIIQHKDEALSALTAQIETLRAKLKVQEEEIGVLSETLKNSPESWIKEKVELVSRVGQLELNNASLKDTVKIESSKEQEHLIRIEELEIELDRVQREMTSLKSAGSIKKAKHVSWGSNSVLNQEQESDYQLPSLSINIKNSHSKFGQEEISQPKSTGDSESVSELNCDLFVRVPHLRSRSIPSTIQL